MTKFPRVCLFHWNEAEALGRVNELEGLGFSVYHIKEVGPIVFRQLREQPPDTFVIDLTRLPSHGREVGATLRANKATRYIPIVFVGGASEKVERIRSLLPDAVYTTWDHIGDDIRTANANPPVQPVKLNSSMDAYAGQSLLKKLGFKPGMVVELSDAPQGFTESLGSLPDGLQLISDGHKAGDMLIWFVRNPQELSSGITAIAQREDVRFLWIAWPKKGSALHAGLTQPAVRQAGLLNGWVDYKICSIDADWSALLFSRRK